MASFLIKTISKDSEKIRNRQMKLYGRSKRLISALTLRISTNMAYKQTAHSTIKCSPEFGIVMAAQSPDHVMKTESSIEISVVLESSDE